MITSQWTSGRCFLSSCHRSPRCMAKDTHTHSLQQMCGQKCFAGVCELFSWVGRTAYSHTVSEPQPCLPGLYLWANLFHRNAHWTFTSCLWLKESLSCLCSCNTEVLYYCCTYNPRTEENIEEILTSWCNILESLGIILYPQNKPCCSLKEEVAD